MASDYLEDTCFPATVEQRAIWCKTVHPKGGFVRFERGEVGQTLAARFEKQVALYPDVLAIKDGGATCTYRTLNQAANRLAHALLATPSEVGHVGLLLDNGITMITAIWAVLKAGRTFIALDPLFPHESLAEMLADARADIVITTPQHKALAETMRSTNGVVVDLENLPDDLSTENLQVLIPPTNRAYITFTSGSTGRPKGIMHSHRDDLHSIMHYTNAFHITPHDQMTLLHSCSFSSGIFDVFRCLLNGATLHVWDFNTNGFIGLADWLLEERITIFHWVPTPFRYFVDTCSSEQRFPDLRLLILGSEAVTWRDVVAYKQLTDPACIMVNRLGATEAYTFSLYFMDHDTEITGGSVPVGYAVPDKEIILYDGWGRQLNEAGRTGEIGVRSRYLALGYWGPPEWTGQAFLPDPDGGDKRIYMTGDLGRFDADGCLEYVGRKDLQVKIRGHRVEIADIEQRLSESDWLKDALVVPREDASGERRLTAYVVPESFPPAFTTADLRTFLASKLPDFMIPSDFVVMRAFPVSPTGKVDRNALSSASASASTEPENAIDRLSKSGQRDAARPSNAFITFEKTDTEQSIPRRFESLVDSYPQRLAVKTRQQTYTYQSLNQYANRIAHALLSEGGDESESVVLVMDQSVRAVAAILGVLKAGKYYVPVDTLDPPVRIRRVLDDVQARLILTEHSHRALITEIAQTDTRVLNVEQLRADLCDENPVLPLTPNHLAYIFYTSGSTGRPKGVMDNHRNVLHNVLRYTNTLHICTEDRLSLIQSPNFSGTVSSVFGALLNGAAICPINLREENLQHLGDWINETGVTIYHSVPTIFRSFLHGDVQFPTVRLIRLEGDRAARLDVELYQKYFNPACLLVNGLGTTESGLCRQYFVDQTRVITDQILPIGYPVTDMDVLLLDDSGQPVEPGENGQIAVKSRYLSLGYWRQPELTQMAFSPDPQDAAVRIYQTGDMGRMRADGCLEYLGRKNFQVKIRGQKVEPAEIEQALLDLSEIREAAVKTHEDEQGEAFLVAYLVSSTGVESAVSDIRAQLRQRLPDVFIPSRYLFLDSLPVTATGKLDRRALPDPSSMAASVAGPADDTAPRTPTEKTLSAIWSDLLGLERVDLAVPFFELGGHSLLAAQMFARIEKQFGKRMPLSSLFQAPTLEALAALIDRDQGSASWASLVPIHPHGSYPPLYFVHDHTGQVIGYRTLARQLGTAQPFYGLQARGLDGRGAPANRFTEMAAHYISAIKTVQPDGPYYLGGWCYGGSLAYEMARQLQATGERVGLLVMVQSIAPDYPQYRPHITRLHRFIYRLIQRLELEWYRLLEMPETQRGQYIFGRFQRIREIGSVRIEKLATALLKKINITLSPSTTYCQDLLQDAHLRAYAHHQFLPYDGPTLLIRVEKQPLGVVPDVSLGWKNLITGDFEIYEVPGYNAGILEEPRVQQVAAVLSARLTQAYTD